MKANLMMFLIKIFLTLISIIVVIDANQQTDKKEVVIDKRRLPENVQQYKWTTTTVKPDEVYIEPLGDMKEYQNRYYIAVPLLYLADPDLNSESADDQFITGEFEKRHVGHLSDLCLKMLERYRYTDGEYVWRPYNSRFYGELRWKKKYAKMMDMGNGQGFRF